MNIADIIYGFIKKMEPIVIIVVKRKKENENNERRLSYLSCGGNCCSLCSLWKYGLF